MTRVAYTAQMVCFIRCKSLHLHSSDLLQFLPSVCKWLDVPLCVSVCCQVDCGALLLNTRLLVSNCLPYTPSTVLYLASVPASKNPVFRLGSLRWSCALAQVLSFQQMQSFHTQAASGFQMKASQKAFPHQKVATQWQQQVLQQQKRHSGC